MKEKFVWNQNRIFSVIIFALSLFFLYETTKIVPTFAGIGGTDPGSRVFPYALCIIMLICSVGKFIKSKEKDAAPFYGSRQAQKRTVIIIAALILFAPMFKYLGFWVATLCESFLLVYLMRKDNKLKWYKVLIFSVVFTVLVYLLFAVAMNVYLPKGELWEKFM